MHIDYSKVFHDKKRNVELVKKIIDAASVDHTANRLTKGKFSERGYERELNASFPKMDNKTAFQTASRTHRIRIGKSQGNASTLSGNDVYRITKFFLKNKGGYGWPTIKQVIENEGAPYTKLLDLERDAIKGGGISFNNVEMLKVGDILKVGEDAEETARAIADHLKSLRMLATEAVKERDMLLKDNMKAKNKVEILEKALKRLVLAYDNSSPDKKEELQTSMEVCKRMLKDLR